MPKCNCMGCSSGDRCTKEIRIDIEPPKEPAQEKEIPMGVSQWAEYGKKYGYWDYFEKEINREVVEELKQLNLKDFYPDLDEGIEELIKKHS